VKSFIRILLALGTIQVLAEEGVFYTAETTSQNMDSRNQDTSHVQAWVLGANAKVLFEQSGNPVAKQGTYLLTNDGGATIFLVNPEDKTYMEWHMDQLMALAGGISKVANLEFSNMRVDKLEESSGERMHGMPTKRYKYKTTYDMKLNMFGIKKLSSVEITSESWVTEQVADAGLGLWLRKTLPTTGDPELDKLIKSEMDKVKGFPLKSKSKTVTRQYNRKETKVTDESITISETIVKDWKRENIDLNTFRIPETYQLTTLPGTEEGSPLKGLFQRRN